jgi:hypothetical protein
MKTVTATVLVVTALGFALITPAYAQAEDCKAMWEKVDVNKDAVADATEGAAVFAAIKASGKTYDADGDGKLSAAEFSAACADGGLKDVKM